MPTLLILLVATLSLGAAPQRIISTAPSFTESLFAIGAGDRVVGVSTYCHYPPIVSTLPKVGTYLKPNIEEIVRLKPDLVLLHKEHQNSDVGAQLKRLGINTLPLSNVTLEDTLDSIRIIGSALGLEKQAEDLLRSMQTRLDTIQSRHKGKQQKTLLFIVGRTPGRLDGLIAVGKGSYLNQVMITAGGRNVFADSPVAYPRISLETVIRLDPDVIIDMGDMAETVGVTEAHKQSVLTLWQSNKGLKAVVGHKVFPVAADIFVVPGPRLVEAAEAFAQMMFGESAK